MASKKTGVYRSSETGQFVVGRNASAKISKIEGLTISKAMRATFSGFDRKGLSADVRRTKLIEKYGKKGN